MTDDNAFETKVRKRHGKGTITLRFSRQFLKSSEESEKS